MNYINMMSLSDVVVVSGLGSLYDVYYVVVYMFVSCFVASLYIYICVVSMVFCVFVHGICAPLLSKLWGGLCCRASL